MVTNNSDRSLDLVFFALSDPIRRSILSAIVRGDATVGELAEPFEVSRPAISKHLNVLQKAGLLHRVPDGRTNWCRFDGKPLTDAIALMEQYRSFWSQQFDALANFLESEQAQ